MSGPTRLAVPDHMAQVVAEAVAAYAEARRAELRAEMESVHTDHRRRDVLAGALAELAYLEEPPEAKKPAAAKPGPAQQRRPLY